MSASARRGCGVVAGSEFNEIQNVSYGVIQGGDISIPKVSFATSKSTKFTKMEKCLLVTMAIQSRASDSYYLCGGDVLQVR